MLEALAILAAGLVAGAAKAAPPAFDSFLATGGTDVDASSYTTSGLPAATSSQDHLVIIFAAVGALDGLNQNVSVSGAGVTWTKREVAYDGASTGDNKVLATFTAPYSGSSGGALTVTYPSTQKRFAYVVFALDSLPFEFGDWSDFDSGDQLNDGPTSTIDFSNHAECNLTWGAFAVNGVSSGTVESGAPFVWTGNSGTINGGTEDLRLWVGYREPQSTPSGVARVSSGTGDWLTTGNQVRGENCANETTGDPDLISGGYQDGTLSVTVNNANGRVDSSPAGISCGVDCTEPYSAGQLVTLTATTLNNSDFGAWSGAACLYESSQEEMTCTVRIDGNMSIQANFSIAYSYLHVTVPSPGGGVLATGSSQGAIRCYNPPDSGVQRCESRFMSDSATLVTLRAEANPGYFFDGWTGCDSVDSNRTCFVTVDQDRFVSASFIEDPNFLLVIEKPENTSVEVVMSDGTVKVLTTAASSPECPGSTVCYLSVPAELFVSLQATHPTRPNDNYIILVGESDRFACLPSDAPNPGNPAQPFPSILVADCWGEMLDDTLVTFYLQS